MEDHSSHLRKQPPAKSSDVFRDSLVSEVKEFVGLSLTNVPADWIAEILRARGLPTAMPMYEKLFMVEQSWLADRVREHVTNFDFHEDRDRQRLIDSGWRVIPKTGLFAFDFDGILLLGVDGIGYDFLDAHWRPLFDLLFDFRFCLDD